MSKMKNTILILAALTLFSCSNDDNVLLDNCDSLRDSVNTIYSNQIDYISNRQPVDYSQLHLIIAERDKRLSMSCEELRKIYE